MEAIWQGLLLFMSRFLELRDIDELALLLVLYHVESGLWFSFEEFAFFVEFRFLRVFEWMFCSSGLFSN